MEVGEVFEAVQSAEKAVEFSSTWVTARQTLGRAQLGIGEVHMVSCNPNILDTRQNTKYNNLYSQALRNFEKGVHLDPSDQEMWSDDLHWAWGLAKEKEKREREGGNKDDEN